MSDHFLKDEAIRLLKNAGTEIRALRHKNEILGAKVETMDTLAAFLFAKPNLRQSGASIDVAWEIERFLADQDESHV